MTDFNLLVLQDEAKEWQAKNFKDAKSYQPLLGLVEEVGELSHAHLKAEQNIRTKDNHFAEKVDAVGDIVVFLAHYCVLNGISLHSAVMDTWHVVKDRDWIKFPQNGRAK